jgi:predicted RND superfamily exporter protein
LSLPHRSRRVAATALVVALTIAAFFAVTARLRLDPNVASLLPEQGEAAALRRYVTGFGGGDLAIVLVEADDADACARASAAVAAALRERPSVRRATDRVQVSGGLDPMLVFRHADARARERIASWLTPEGMHARLAETRALLLAPGAGALAEAVAADPLRLAQAVAPGAGAGMRTQPDGAFATDDGKVHLVLAEARGEALRGADARAFVADAEAVMAEVGRAHPGARLGLTGGHAIAAATEAMLTRDLQRSGTLSMVLASLAFALTFRRLRALAAVMPPLVLGTVWTAGLAAVLPGGLSAIAVAFMSVVVGVGVDTGVHVYAALLEARREGLAPRDAAAAARARMARPALLAAVTAASAFAALALSDIGAVRQLGLLCAAGEVLTAIAIVLVAPEVGAWLERGPPPAARPPGWPAAIAALTRTRPRAAIVSILSILPILAVALGGAPPLAESVVAIRPNGLAPLEVQARIFEAFGGETGQWVVLVADRDLERARERGDAVVDALSALRGDVESIDSLTALAPARATQEARFAARDALDLPARAGELERALRDAGFAPGRFAGALDGMRRPARRFVELADLDQAGAGVLAARYLAEDAGEHLVALYVRPSRAAGAGERIEAAIHAVDPAAMVTGYGRLEAALRASLSRDLPRIGLVAGLLVILALAASLRRARDVALAALVVAAEIALVLLAVRELAIPLHAYSALVIPVLLGITVDEGLFLLHRARQDGDAIARTLAHEGPIVAATALTTAAGFGALALCDYDGLRDLGLVGALGSATGVVVALLVVPAGLVLVRRRGAPPASPRS